MKENDSDDNIEENEENQENKEDNIVFNQFNKLSQGLKLKSIDSLIESQEEPKLVSMDTILREGSYDDFDSTFTTNEDEEEIKHDNSIAQKIYNFKDFIFIFALLMSSAFNYNFLYLPLIILGIILSFLMLSNSKRKYSFKNYFELITIIYTFLLLIFKIVSIVLIKKNNKWVFTNKDILINLGIKLLRDKDSTTYLVTTFLGESILLVISIIAKIISSIYVDYDLNEEKKKKISKEEMLHLLIKNSIINYFVFIGLAIFNVSIITLIYVLVISILLFFIARHSNIRIISISFKLMDILMYILVIIQIFFINLLNTYHFYDLLTSKEFQNEGNQYYYSAFTQIGISLMPNSQDLTEIFLHLTSYFFNIISLITLALSNNSISFQKIYSISENKILDEENENISNNIIIKILRRIKEYFTSPNFILHICRCFALCYLYFLRNFFAIIIFIWLLFSFLFLRVHSNKCLTYVLAFTIIFSLIFIHFGNINGLFDGTEKVFNIFDSYHFCLSKINKKLEFGINYFCYNLFYFFVTLFIYSLFADSEKRIKKATMANIKIKENKEIEENKENKEIEEIKEEQNENILEENLIENKDKDNDNDNDKEIIITDKTNENLMQKEEEDNLDEDKIRERRVTQQILPKKEEEKDKSKQSSKIEINEELIEKVTLFNIITKTFLKHIDKISLVVMYFVAIKTINIIHAILALIFMLQLLFPQLIEVISIALIIITQLLFFSEFAVDILKHYDYFSDKFKNNKNLMKLFMDFNPEKTENTLEIFIYAIVYCFYIQYTLYNNEVYKEIVLHDEINLSNFIEIKLFDYPTLKKIFYFIGRIILEIYIWILITLFIFFDSSFEISILFEIKLFFFFIIVFQFLISIQKSEKHRISLILNWIFLIYSSLNTLLVYGYQISCLDYFNENNSDGSVTPDNPPNNENGNNEGNFFKMNLPNIGFSKYPENLLYYKFLPHFACNFISVLFIWEMKRILLRSNDIDKDNRLEIENKIENEKKEKEEKNDNEVENEENEENNDEEINIAEKYEKNKNEMSLLNLSYYFYNIILIITKFYWLFLFLVICILFTSYDLSIILILYIFIFDIVFVSMFYQIITNLTNFIRKKSFFISRLLRYNIIEQKMHVRQNKYYRSLAFKYLLWLSFSTYLLFYSFGVFNLIQNGCDEKKFDCVDSRHKAIFSEDNELLIQSWVYLIGFFVDSRIDSVFKEAWYHLFLSFLLAFDVYVQRIENYFNEEAEKNRQRYRQLQNENTKLKPLTYGEDNILINIAYGVKEMAEKNENNDISRSGEESLQESDEANNNIISTSRRLRGRKDKKRIKLEKEDEGIKFDFEVRGEQEEIKKGKKIIKEFLKIFEKAVNIDVKLSTKNYKYKFVKIIKKIFEEIIIFLLICTSISKMNFWSIIYMMISLGFILTEKTMMGYYKLYCFMLFSIFIQTVVFVSNIQPNTDPYPDDEILNNLNKTLKIPWYRERLDIDDKLGFFYSLGVSHSQINLIWMEFVEVVIIYIYLDYFSYSIYQDSNTIGRSQDKKNKINYYNLYLNKETSDIAKKLSQEEYEKHKVCMKYNFDIDILKYNDFIYYMEKGVIKANQDEKESILPVIPEIPRSSFEIKTTENIEKNEGDLQRFKTLDNYDEEKNKLVSPLLQKLARYKNEAKKANLLEESKVNSKATTEYFSIFKDFIYLSFHNVILIIIIIISMMIASFFSIFYITYSLYFLITSTSIYLGNKYSYPKAIKTILRITILLDITIQIFYQNPYINSAAKEDKEEIDFSKILKIIGLNKILTFKQYVENEKIYEVVLDYEQLFLVLAKAITYLFMSFQLLVYNSQDFQEYYLSYIITKNNNLRRISLMNVFKFNNNRIEAMNKSINLRHDMSQSMTILKTKLDQWNENLMKTKLDEKLKDSSQGKEQNKEKEKEKGEEIVNENSNIGFNFFNDLKNLTEEKEEKDEDKNKDKKLSRMKIDKMKKEGKEGKEEEEEEEKDEEEEKKKEEEQKETPFKKGGFFANLNLPINPIVKKEKEKEEEGEIKKEDEYLPENEVYQKIKEWILGGFLIKIQILLHKYASNYTNIEKNERDIYERDTIQGKTKITSFIENMVELQLSTIDLSCFTRAEMKEVKSYFDGTRAKKLKELKKEKETKKKIQDAGNKIIKMNKLIQNNKNKIKEIGLISSKKDIKINEKKDSFTNNNIGILEEVKKQQEKEKENIIDLNQAKFKNLEKFISGKLFIKYLSKSYILQSIFMDILSFFLNNFHWLCYLIMILNHIMSASLLTMFYPLSIFCYALLEYPRPKKSYWTFCLIYTVILLSSKFIMHLEVFRYIKIGGQPITYYLKNLYRYKIGFNIYDSSFSTDFLECIIYDALVLIFLLINDYLLVASGIYNKREQDIENIYQAMERIAKTKDLEIKDWKEIKKFNDSYLIPSNRKTMTKEEKKSFRFNKLLPTDEFEEENSKRLTKSVLVKALKLKKSKLNNELTKNKKTKTEINKQDKNPLIKKLDEEIKKEIVEKKEYDNKYNESKRKYFEKLFPKIRNEKPGNEYYAAYTISMLLIIIFILIYYTTMVQDKNFGAVELDTKQFSGAMVIVLILHVGVLVYDRILFISQNRNNIKYEYILYDKETKIPLSEMDFNKIKVAICKSYPEMKKDKFIIPAEYTDKLKEKYNIVYIQNEDLNLPLVQKYILHILIVVFAHIFIFFYCPMKGNININNSVFCDDTKTDGNAIFDGDDDENSIQCNDFLTNKALIVFYLIYIIYFISSGLQVKYGFYDMKRKSMLKSGDSWVNGIIYNSFKAIPFLYEIKLAIDWTFTKTCLDIFQWNKFESVYDIVYTTYCAMTAKNQQPVGVRQGKLIKIGMGGGLSFFLIGILVAPLMLFSSLNPTNQMNNLTGATLKIDLSFVYKNRAVKNYTLYENSKPESIESIFREGNDWDKYNYSVSAKTKNFPKNQIQTVQFFRASDKNWDLARPHIINLRNLILDRNNNSDLEYIGLVVDYNFERPLPAESMSISKRYSTTIYYYSNHTEEQDKKLDKLGNALLKCHDESIEFESIYSPPIRLSANIKPKRLLDKKYFPNLDIKIGFQGCRKEKIINNKIEEKDLIPDEKEEDEKIENEKSQDETNKEEENEKEKEEIEESKENENIDNKQNLFEKRKLIELKEEEGEKGIVKEEEEKREEKEEEEKKEDEKEEDEKKEEKEEEDEKEDEKKEANYLESYFTVEKIMTNKNGTNETEGIKFHVFSDQVSTTTSGKNILTFYVSFVLLIGGYVRSFFAGQPEKIMLTEMPHSEEIINLCEGIKVSRNSFDFEQEEKLYYILIEIMRSPDYLRTLTTSSTEQFKQRQELTKNSKTSDDF